MQIERFTYNPQFLIRVFWTSLQKVAIPLPPSGSDMATAGWHSRCQTDHASVSLASDRGVKRWHLELTPTVLHGSNVSFLFNSAPEFFKMLVAKIVRNRNFRTSPKIWRTRAVYTWVIRSSTLHIIACANKLRLYTTTKRQTYRHKNKETWNSFKQ